MGAAWYNYSIDAAQRKTTATKTAVQKTKGDGNLKNFLPSAGQVMAIATLKKAVDHPLVAGVVAGLEDW